MYYLFKKGCQLIQFAIGSWILVALANLVLAMIFHHPEACPPLIKRIGGGAVVLIPWSIAVRMETNARKRSRRDSKGNAPSKVEPAAGTSAWKRFPAMFAIEMVLRLLIVAWIALMLMAATIAEAQDQLLRSTLEPLAYANLGIVMWFALTWFIGLMRRRAERADE